MPDGKSSNKRESRKGQARVRESRSGERGGGGTFAQLLDLQGGEEQVADVDGVLGQVGAAMRDAVEDDSTGVADQPTQLWLLGRFQQHFFDKKTWQGEKDDWETTFPWSQAHGEAEISRKHLLDSSLS